MATKQTVSAPTRAGRLVPTEVTEATLGTVLFDTQVHRRRPRVAQKPDGTMVVCSGRTARKHGWTIVATCFSRSQYKVAAE